MHLVTLFERDKKTDIIKNCFLEGLLGFSFPCCFGQDFIYVAVISVIFLVMSQEICLALHVFDCNSTTNKKTTSQGSRARKATIYLNCLSFKSKKQYSMSQVYFTSINGIHSIDCVIQKIFVSVLLEFNWTALYAFMLILSSLMYISNITNKTEQILKYWCYEFGCSIYLCNINGLNNYTLRRTHCFIFIASLLNKNTRCAFIYCYITIFTLVAVIIHVIRALNLVIGKISLSFGCNNWNAVTDLSEY